jgi:hypothetical protein
MARLHLDYLLRNTGLGMYEFTGPNAALVDQSKRGV